MEFRLCGTLALILVAVPVGLALAKDPVGADTRTSTWDTPTSTCDRFWLQTTEPSNAPLKGVLGPKGVFVPGPFFSLSGSSQPLPIIFSPAANLGTHPASSNFPSLITDNDLLNVGKACMSTTRKVSPEQENNSSTPRFEHIPFVAPGQGMIFVPPLERVNPIAGKPTEEAIPPLFVSTEVPTAHFLQLEEPTYSNATAFRSFLRSNEIDEVLCTAIRSLFSDIPVTKQCAGTMINASKTLSYSVTSTHGAAGTYEITIQGDSVELALKHPDWVERHRFFVAIGFDGELRPSFTVVDFEPMLRTTKNLPLEQDILFQYISRDKDTDLAIFADRIKDAIYKNFQNALETYKRQLTEISSDCEGPFKKTGCGR